MDFGQEQVLGAFDIISLSFYCMSFALLKVYVCNNFSVGVLPLVFEVSLTLPFKKICLAVAFFSVLKPLVS